MDPGDSTRLQASSPESPTVELNRLTVQQSGDRRAERALLMRARDC